MENKMLFKSSSKMRMKNEIIRNEVIFKKKIKFYQIDSCRSITSSIIVVFVDEVELSLSSKL